MMSPFESLYGDNNNNNMLLKHQQELLTPAHIQPQLIAAAQAPTSNAAHRSTADDVIPFDSPSDHSLCSPASTRDFSNSPFADYEFDFGSVEDAIMFPDHGTQEVHSSDNFLAGVPLFASSDYVNQSANEQALPSSFPTASQHKEQMALLNTQSVVPETCDFSFDAMTNNLVSGAAPLAPSPTPSLASTVTSSLGSESINQLAAVFVREYARTHDLNDIDVLLRALRSAGIAVSDQVVADLVASGVNFMSRSPSPATSLSPAASSQHPSPQTMESAPVSPMNLPPSMTASPEVKPKSRSSLQASSKDALVVDTSYGKRFICPTCHKQFDRAFNLRTHAMTHIDPEDRDKPFHCPWSECGKNFSRKYDAERHYRSVHLKRGEVASRKQVQMALSGHFTPALESAANG